MAAVAPPSSRGPASFQLLELLESLPGVFSDHLLASLQPRHKASLALTCRVLRDAVHQSVTSLVLRAGGCCLSRLHQLSNRLLSVSHLVLKPGNLHEAMFVVPLFLITVRWWQRMHHHCHCYCSAPQRHSTPL